ncbi:MAG TPA: hypothetical protein VMT74_02815, partial [Gaiellaceae bacterium]|nr:hypothetical protein [Gaiellaceae bacterium]
MFRFRGARHVLAAVGLIGLAVPYASGFAAFRQPAYSPPAPALPVVGIPLVRFPELAVPKLRRPVAVPAAAPRASASRHAKSGAQRTRRIPVVTDKRSLPGSSGIAKTNKPVDLFANRPVVVDTVGVPPVQPASGATQQSAPAAPAPAPAAPADTKTGGTDATQSSGGDATPAAPHVGERSLQVVQQGGDGASGNSGTTGGGDAAPPSSSGDTISAGTPPDTTSSSSTPAQAPVDAPAPQPTVPVTGVAAPPQVQAPVSSGADGAPVTAVTGGGATVVAPPQVTTTDGQPSVTPQSPAPSTTSTDGSQPVAGASGGSGGAGGTTTTPQPGAAAGDGTSSTTATTSTAPTGTTPPPPDPAATPGSGPSPPGLVTPAGGGSAVAGDGSATVAFAPGLVTGSTVVSVSTTDASPLGIVPASAAYDLTATDTTTGATISHFSGSPVLTISYDPSAPTPTAIYYLDPVNGPVALPSTVDTVNHTISAALPHFSTYIAGSPANVALALAPQIVQASHSTTITATVTQGGIGADTATVDFVAGGSATFDGDVHSCVTGSDGTCTVTISDTATEAITVQASVELASPPATASTTVLFVPFSTTSLGTGQQSVSLGGFVQFSGAVTVESHGLVSAKLDDGSTAISGISLYTAALTGGTLFAGANAGTSSAAGLQGSIGSLVAAFFFHGSDAWQAVSASFDASVTGIPGLTLSATGATVSYNGTSSGHALDLTQVDPADGTTYGTLTVDSVSFDGFTGSLAKVHAGSASVGVGGFVSANGAVDLTQSDVTLTTPSVNGGAAADATLLDVSVTGASLSVGAGGLGFSANSTTLEVAVVKPVSSGSDQTSFVGAQGSIGSADLTGASDLFLHVAGATFAVNQATDSTGASSASRLDWTTALSGSHLPGLTMGSNVIARVSGAAAVSIAGVLDATTSSMTLDHSTVSTGNDGNGIDLSGADVWSLSFTSPDVFVGTGSALTPSGSASGYDVSSGTVGIRASATSLELARISKGGTTYDGVQVDGLTGSFVGIPAVQLELKGAYALANVSSGGARLNFAGLSSGVLPFTIGASDTTSLELSGAAALSIAGVVTSTGSFTVDHSTGVSGSDGNGITFSGADVWAFGATGATVFVGTGGSLTPSGDPSGFSVVAGSLGVSGSASSLDVAQISASGTTYVGVEVDGVVVDLVGVPGVTLHASSGSVLSNSSSGGSKLSWAGLSSGVLPFSIGASASTSLHLAGSAALSIAGVVVATGTFSVDHTTGVSGSDGNGTTFSGADVWAFGATGVTVFVGTGGSLTVGYAVVPGTLGVSGSASSLDVAQISSGGTTYTGVQAGGVSADLVGVTGLTVHVESGSALSNTSSGGSKLNFTGLSSGVLPFTIAATENTALHLSGAVAVAVTDVIAATADSFTLDYTTGISGSDGNGIMLSGADVWALALTAPSLFVGAGGTLSANSGAASHFVVSDGSVGVSGSAASIELARILNSSTTYVGVEVDGATVSLVGVTGLTVHVAGASVVSNTSSGGSKLDFAGLSSGVLPFTIAASSLVSLHVSGAVAVSVGGAVVATADSATIDHTSAGGSDNASSSPIMLSDADVWAFSLGSSSVFVGVGGGLTPDSHAASGYDVSNGSVGVTASVTGVKVAEITDGAASYTGVEVDGLAGDLVGLPGLTLHLAGGSALANSVSGSSTKLNWAGLDSGVLPFSFDSGLTRDVSLHLSGAVALSLAGVVAATSDGFTLDHTSASGSDNASSSPISLSGADVWAFGLQGSSVFVGVGGGLSADSHATSGYDVSNGSVGVAASVTGLKLAAITDGSTTYTGFEVDGLSGDLVGLTGVTAHVAGVTALANLVSGSTTKLNWAGLDSGVIPFSFDSGLTRSVSLHLAGAAALDLAGVVAATANSFTLDHTTASGSDNASSSPISLSDADVWAFSLGGSSVFVGIGGGLTPSGSASGYDVSNGSVGVAATVTGVKLAQITAGTTAYTGVEVDGLSGDLLGLPGLTVHVVGVTALANLVSGSTTKLSWAGLDSGVLPFSFDGGLTRSVSLHLAGAAALELADVVAATTDSFTVDHTSASGSDNASSSPIALSGADVWAFSLGSSSVFVGAGGGLTPSGSPSGYDVSNGSVGFSGSVTGVKLATITQGSVTYTGVEVDGLTSSLVGVPGLTVHVAGAKALANVVSGSTTKLNWAGLAGGVLPFSFDSALTRDVELHLSGAVAVLISGAVAATADSFSLDHTTASGSDNASSAPITLSGADVWAFSLGSSSVFVGAGGGLTPSGSASGFDVTNGSVGVAGSVTGVKLALISQGGASYTGVQVDGLSGDLVGVTGLTVHLGGGTALANTVSGSTTKLNWAGLDSGILPFTFDSALTRDVSLHLSGAVALSIAGAVAATADSFTLDHTTASGSDNASSSPISLSGADVWAFSLGSSHVFVGVGGGLTPDSGAASGYDVSSGSVGVSGSVSGVEVALISQGGASYTGVQVDGLSGDLDGVTGLTVHVGGASALANSVSGSTTKLNWAGLDSGIVPFSFDSGLTRSVALHLSGAVALSLAGVVAATADSFTLDHTTATGSDNASSSPITLSGADVWAFSLGSSHVFVGVGGGLTPSGSASGFDVTDGTIGVSATVTGVKVADIAAGSTSYTGVEVDGLGGDLVGLPGLTVHIVGVTALANSVSGSATKLNWAGLDSGVLPFSFSSGLTRSVALHLAGAAAIELADVVAATADSFTLDHTSASGSDNASSAPITLSDADVWAFSLGSSSVFVGVGGGLATNGATTTGYEVTNGSVGISASVTDVKVAEVTQGAVTYTAVQVDGLNGDLVGVPALTVHVAGASALANLVSGSTTKLDWAGLAGGVLPVSFDSALTRDVTLHFAGALALELAGVIAVTADSFSADHTTASGSDNGSSPITLTDADVWAFSLGSSSVFVGGGGSLTPDVHAASGYDVSDGSVGFSGSVTGARVATIAQGAVTYTGVEVDGLTSSLAGVPGLTVHVAGASALANAVSGSTAKLNWAGLDSGILPFSFDAALTSSVELHLSGAVAVSAGGVVAATADSFSLDHTTASGSDNGSSPITLTDADVWAFSLGSSSVFVGAGAGLTPDTHAASGYDVSNGSVGVAGSVTGVKLALISQGGASYTGVEVDGLSGDLDGVPGLTVHVAGATALANTVSGSTAKLNWAGLDSGILPFMFASGLTSDVALHLSGAVALELAGVVAATADSVSLDHTTASGSDNASSSPISLSGADVWAFSLGSASVFVGVGGALTPDSHAASGYDVSNGSVGVSGSVSGAKVALISQGGASYTGVEVDGLSGSLVGITGVTVDVAGASALANVVSGSATKLNWAGLDSGVLPYAFASGLTRDVTLHLSGAVALDIAGVVAATADSFTLDHTTASGSDNASSSPIALSDADVWAFDLAGAHVFVGVGGGLSADSGAASGYDVSNGTVGVAGAVTDVKLAQISQSGASYAGVEVDGLSGDLVGLPGLTVHVAGVTALANSVSGSTTKLNWAGLDSGVLPFSFASGLTRDVTLHLSGAAALSIGSFLAATADSFTLDHTTASGSDNASSSPITLSGADVWAFQLGSAHVFVGLGATLTPSGSPSGYDVGDGTVGLDTTVSGGIDVAAITQGTDTYTAVEADGIGGTFIGLDPVTLTVSGVKVLYNAASGAAKLNWAGLDGGILPFTFSSDLTRALTFHLEGSATVAFGGFLTGSAGFSVTESNVDVTTPTLHAANLLAITLTSPTLSIGTSSFGLTLGGSTATVTIASLTPATPDGRSWTAVQGSNLGGSLTVGSLVTATVSGVSIDLNSASGTGATPLDWNGVMGSGITLSGSSAFAVSGTLTNLSIANGLITGSSTFTVSESTINVTVGGTALTGAELLTLGLGDLSLTVGSASGPHFSITGGSLAVAALSAPTPTDVGATDTRSWLGVIGAITSASLVSGIPDVSLTVDSLTLRLNQATGAYTNGSTVDATPLDWTTALDLNTNGTFGQSPDDQLTVGGIPIDLTGATFVVSGTADVQLFGMITGQVSFAFQQQTVSVDVDRDGMLELPVSGTPWARGPPGPDLQNATLTTFGLSVASGHTLSFGVGGVGFTVSAGSLALAIVTPSAAAQAAGDGRSWLALDAQITSASFTGIPGLTLTVTGLTVEINRASGVYTIDIHNPAAGTVPTQALDWTKSLDLDANGHFGETTDQLSVAISGSGSIPIAFTGTTSLKITGTATIDFESLISGTVGFALTTQTITGTTANPIGGVTGLTSASLTTLAITATSLFVGYGTVGFQISGGGLAIASLTPTDTTDTRSWLGLQADLSAGSLNGVPGLTFTVSSLQISTNSASGGASLDWTKVQTGGVAVLDANGVTHTIAMTGDTPLVISGNASIDVAGLLAGSVHFVITQSTVDDMSVGLTGADLLTIALSNVQLAVGTTSIGAQIGGGSLTIGLLVETNGPRRWFGLSSSNLSASLVLPGVTASISNLSVQVNEASGAGATALDWSTVQGNPLPGLSGDQLSADGDLSNLSIFGILSGSAHVSFARQTVDVQLPGSVIVSGATLVSFSLSLGGGETLQAGVPGFGLTVTDGTLLVAAIAPAASSDARRWIAVQGSNLAATLTIPGITATVTSLDVSFNNATGGASPIDWTT